MSDEFKSFTEIKDDEVIKNPEKKAELMELLKNTLVMLAIAVVAGGILGVVYEVTKEPIAIMEAKEKQAANQKVFMLASSFSDSIDISGLTSETLENDYSGVDITDCIEAYDAEGNILGYVLEVTSHEGYGGDIVFRIGIENDGNINAISITDISETAGLGMRAEEVLVPQFKNRNEASFEVTKTGAISDNQIDAISSATITSKAVTKGVNAALVFFRECLLGGEGNES